MGGGKGGGGGSVPYQNELSQMVAGSLANRLLKSDPQMGSAFKPDTALGNMYSGIFGGSKPQGYEGFGKIPAVGTLTQQARQGVYGSPRGSYKGAGAYSPVPTGGPMATPEYKPQAYQPINIQTPQTKAISAYNINPQQFQLAKQVGMETIGQGAKMAQGDLMRQMGARGMGQSGFAAKAAADLYNRGAGLQASQLGRSLASEQMGQQFQAGQQAQQLEANRQLQQGGLNLQAQQQALTQKYQQAGLSADEAKTRAGLEMQNRAQNLQTSLGLGQLGLQERGQGLQELTAQRSWEDAPLSALAGLGQSITAASAGQGGKGK